MPLFSIVIPVRDRANMLRYALQSVLNQTYGNYEVVVSDNCSSDNTGDVVREFNDGRIRYFRTDKVLPMHENYEFVFSKAKGDWVICLTSRFVMWRKALEIIASVIEEYKPQLINWQYGLYHTDTWFEPKRRNNMVLYPYDKKVTERYSDDALRRMFNLSYHDFDVPQAGYTAYRQDLLKKIKQENEYIFLPPAPDRTSCVAVLGTTPKFYHINMPLMLSGVCGESNGASCIFGQGNEFLKFLSEYKDIEIIKYTPLHINVAINHTADSVLRVKALQPERFSHLELDFVEYFTRCFAEIMNRQVRGLDVKYEKNEIFNKLKLQPIGIRLRVLMKIILKTPLSCFKQMIGPFNDDSKILRYLSYLVTKRQVICGNDAGFSNILEAEHYLNKVLDRDIGN